MLGILFGMLVTALVSYLLSKVFRQSNYIAAKALPLIVVRAAVTAGVFGLMGEVLWADQPDWPRAVRTALFLFPVWLILGAIAARRHWLKMVDPDRDARRAHKAEKARERWGPRNDALR